MQDGDVPVAEVLRKLHNGQAEKAESIPGANAHPVTRIFCLLLRGRYGKLGKSIGGMNRKVAYGFLPLGAFLWGKESTKPQFARILLSEEGRRKMRRGYQKHLAVGLRMWGVTVLFATLWSGSAGAACWCLDRQWPTEGSPASVAVDAAGYVYATCQNATAGVQKYDTDGKLVTQWGPRGGAAGQLIAPQGIAVDKAGNVYVADTGNRRIQKFRGDGKFISQWRTFARGTIHTFRPFGIATEASGQYVYVTDDANSRVLKFTIDGFPVREWGGYGRNDAQFTAPRHVITDSSGFVYVVDSSGNCVKKFSPLGAFENAWGGESENPRLVSPVGVTVDYSGYLWITDRSHRVQQFWQPVRRKGWFGGCNHPEHTETGYWHEFTTDHQPAGGASAGQFTDPQGVAVDLAGNLYVADFANRRIQKLASLETSKPGASALSRLSWGGNP